MYFNFILKLPRCVVTKLKNVLTASSQVRSTLHSLQGSRSSDRDVIKNAAVAYIADVIAMATTVVAIQFGVIILCTVSFVNVCS